MTCEGIYVCCVAHAVLWAIKLLRNFIFTYKKVNLENVDNDILVRYCRKFLTVIVINMQCDNCSLERLYMQSSLSMYA